MKIAFIRESEVQELNPDIEKSKPLGATESCFIQLAHQLSSQHTVKVICPCKSKFYGKVEYNKLPDERIILDLHLSLFSPDIIIVVGNPRLLFVDMHLYRYKLIFWQQNHPLELTQYRIQELVKDVPIVLPSEEAKTYCQNFYKSKNIYGIYNGVRDNFFNVHSKKIKNKIVYVGSLVRSKGFLELLKITKLLPQYDFNICGSFDMYGYIDEAYKKECMSIVSKNVTFLGGLNKDELARQLSEAELCIVNPLVGNLETCCVSALESMAIGTPVIAGGNSIIDQIIKHGGTSYTENLQEQIRYVLENKVEIDKEWINRLSYKNIVSQWNELFETIK